MFNSITVIGHLTHDPELKHAGETVICNFTVAVNRKYKDEDEVLFLAVVAFGKTAENVSAHMEKGKRVLVSGRLQSRKYETSSGDKRETYEVVAEKVVFL